MYPSQIETMDVDADNGDPPSPPAVGDSDLESFFRDFLNEMKSGETTPAPASAPAISPPPPHDPILTSVSLGRREPATYALTGSTLSPANADPSAADPIRTSPSYPLTQVTSLGPRRTCCYAMAGDTVSHATEAASTSMVAVWVPREAEQIKAEPRNESAHGDDADEADDESDSDIEYTGCSPPKPQSLAAAGATNGSTPQNIVVVCANGTQPGVGALVQSSRALGKRREREWTTPGRNGDGDGNVGGGGPAKNTTTTGHNADDASDTETDRALTRSRSRSHSPPLRSISPAYDGAGPCPTCRHTPRTARRRGRGSRVLSPAVRANITALICGAPTRGRATNPESHIRKTHPHLAGWEAITRAVGARPADLERVRHAAGDLMRELPMRVERAEI